MQGQGGGALLWSVDVHWVCRLWMQKGPLQDIIMKIPKVKDEEIILKAAREKHSVTYRGVPIRLSADFSKETLQARRDWQEIFSHEKQRSTAKIALPSKAII